MAEIRWERGKGSSCTLHRANWSERWGCKTAKLCEDVLGDEYGITTGAIHAAFKRYHNTASCPDSIWYEDIGHLSDNNMKDLANEFSVSNQSGCYQRPFQDHCLQVNHNAKNYSKLVAYKLAFNLNSCCIFPPTLGSYSLVMCLKDSILIRRCLQVQ